MAKSSKRYTRYVLNCDPSSTPEADWTYEDAVSAGLVADQAPPPSKDLRKTWWPVRNQGTTGACVGFATADGVLRWHYVTANKIRRTDRPSPRFIWMANKETDEITSYPTTFIEAAGTQTKLALRVARNYGCVLEQTLPMSGRLARLSTTAFYAQASRLRLASYHNLGREPDKWLKWIANHGPILTRLNVDATWDSATQNNGRLATY